MRVGTENFEKIARFDKDFVDEVRPKLEAGELVKMGFVWKSPNLEGTGKLRVSKPFTRTGLLNASLYWDNGGVSDLGPTKQKVLEFLAKDAIKMSI